MLARATQGIRRSLGSLALPEYITGAPATEMSRLRNGVRVASQSGHGETATVGVFIDAGSRYETAETSGTAHFLEHLTFKGTAKMNQQQLEMEFENMGGHLNAYTSREHTVYYAKVFKNDVPKALNILADMLTAPKLDEGAIERERSVILREMEEVNQQMEEVIFDLLHETAYPNGGLGRTILGPEANIKRISRGNLEDYIKTHYTGPRVVVAGAGAVDHAALTRLAEGAFGGLPSAPPAGRTPAPSHTASVFQGSQLRLRNDDVGLAHLAVGFETGGWTHPHAFPLMVAQTLLGAWDRTQGGGVGGNTALSPLCRKVGTLGLAHSLSTFNTTYTDTGLFGVYAVAEPAKLWELSSEIMFEMVRLCHSVGEEEVERAKVALKTALLGNLDGSTAVCEDIGRQVLAYGRRMSPAEILARIDAVDTTALASCARAYIDDKECVTAGAGTIHEMPDANWYRRRTFKLTG